MRDPVFERTIDQLIDRFYVNEKLCENFNKTDDIYKTAVNLAYTDAQRTLIGIGNCEVVKKRVITDLAHCIGDYINGFYKSDCFDAFHERACDLWVESFSENYNSLADYGKAQKIVNMSFKYLFAYYYQKADSNCLNKLCDCHFTLDSYTLKWLNSCGVERKPKCIKSDVSWSKLNKDDYKEIQDYSRRCVCKIMPGCNRIRAEFLVWEGVRLFDVMNAWAYVEKNSESDFLIKSVQDMFINQDSVQLNSLIEKIINTKANR